MQKSASFLGSIKHFFFKWILSSLFSDIDNTIHTTYRAEIPALQSVSTNEDDYGDGSDSFDAMLQKMKEKLQENKK